MFSTTPNKAEQSHQNGSFPIVTHSDHGKRNDVLNSSASEINIDNGDDDDDEDPMIYYHDCSVAYQSPQHSPSKIPAVVPPVIYSPKLDNIKLRTDLTTVQVEKRARASDHAIKAHKKRQTLYSPQDSILLFLRNKHIEALHGSSLHSSNHFKRGYMKFCLNGERRSGITWKPFLDMKDQLEDAPCALSMFHQRLIVEDFMLLEPGDSLICLMSSAHYMLNASAPYGSKSLSNHWKTTIKFALESLPLKPVVFSGITYFPFTIDVHSNPSYNNFVDKNMTKSEIEHLCTYKGGGGIYCNISLGKGSTCRELFKFYDLINCYHSIQFWKIQLSSQIPNVKACLRHYKDIPSLAPRVLHFLNEFEGDSSSTLPLVQYYELRVKDMESDAKFTTYKASAISSNKLIANFSLTDDDTRLAEFRDYVEDITKSAVMKVYGNFVDFTSPLLSQSELSMMANKFKLTLTEYYQIIIVLLNKMVSVKCLNSYQCSSFY
jgi:hypothetical protein